MRLTRMQSIVVGSWLVLTASLVVVSIVVGIPASASQTATLLMIGAAVATALLVFFKGARPQTIPKILHKGEHQ